MNFNGTGVNFSGGISISGMGKIRACAVIPKTGLDDRENGSIGGRQWIIKPTFEPEFLKIDLSKRGRGGMKSLLNQIFELVFW